ncbi:zinc/cadmium resistance protein [Takifugu rubripes]|uniref:zinc/cadmium resistance protein n=1 Tax=Takifugu rubripes TaxID=31033 RepID=UPI001145E795|nr:zinc/cadmium resistance protein-like [Takifugu rubripes]XP_029700337.1 zinc/cadmium resistance protein-like [Takifugu rubripes]
MKVLKWSLTGATMLLLVCQVAISQLCKSNTVLMDGFHTLFLLISIALTADTRSRTPPDSSLEFFASPIHNSNLSAESPVEPQLGTRPFPPGKNLRQISPPALGCGLNYKQCRIPIVRSFISALVLASLSLSSTIDIIGLFLEPKLVWLPLLLVVISSCSVLLKMLFLWFYWDRFSDASLHLSRGERAKGRAEPGRVLCDVSRLQSAADDSLLNGALVLCNPATSGPSDSDARNPGPQGGHHLPAAAPQQCGDEDQSHSKGVTSQMSEECCTANVGPTTSDNSPHHMEEALQKPLCLLLSVCGIQVLGAAVLALIHSLALLVHNPQCLRGSGTCSPLIYLDPCFSLLAMVILFAICIPQVSRHGMLLLEATPLGISVSDLQQKIESVPGVQSAHDLHIWELSELFLVASVHVHCHSDFKTDRCADLLSEVLKVLQSVGVSCCTIQPEFASCSGPSITQSEEVSRPHRPTCSLACPVACTASVCCSPSEVETIPPPAAAALQESQLTDLGN